MNALKFPLNVTRCAAIALMLGAMTVAGSSQAGATPPLQPKTGFFHKLFGGGKPRPAAPAASFAAAQTDSALQQPAGQTPAAVKTPAQAPAAQTPAAQAPAPTQVPQVKPPDAAPTDDQNEPFRISARANLVNLVFTVTDKEGRFRKDLKRENFGLLDNGRPPQAVIGFTQQTNLPLRIGIMLDTSSSIRTRFKFEQDSALDFFLELLKPGDRAFVEGFDVQVALTQDYTANVDLLNTGIRKLRPGGGTALFDALYKTCQGQMLTLRDATDVRKVIIMVSDGEDNYSHALESDAIKMCQRAETVVYAISTDTSPSRGHGSDALDMIAKQTGGQVFYPTRLEEMAIYFKNIEEELRSQYSLEYRPADFKLDGGFRTIYLQSTDRRFKVRARTGYFAPKAGQ